MKRTLKSLAIDTFDQYKQQNLPSVECILTLLDLSLLLLICSVLCITLGSAITYQNSKIAELTFDYSHCINSTVGCDYFRETNPASRSQCTCYVNFELGVTMKKNVYLYYVLGNYYQNHRLYKSSVDFDQLAGSSSPPSSNCDPYRVDDSGIEYAPCGIVANALFNDSISIEKLVNLSYHTVPLSHVAIAWAYDKNVFKNRRDWTNQTHPPSWRLNVWELDPANPSNNGYENEDLISWMKISATKYAKKFYRRVNHSDVKFQDGLPPGKYRFKIEYNYPVLAFGGYKQIILANTGIFGRRAIFLPVVFFILGGLLLISSVVVYFIHLKLLETNSQR